MPTVTKSSQMLKGPHGIKSRIWSLEGIITWLLRLILNMAFFFTFLYIGETQWDISVDYITYFISIFIIYIISGVIAFVLSYMIIKYVFGRFLHRQVRDIKTLFKGKSRMKKLWIYVFTVIFQTIFFMLSVSMIIADKIPLSDGLAYIVAWIIIWVVARVLGRLLFFIFYTW